MGVIVSPAVWAELMASGEPRPGVRELARTPSLLQKRLALSSLMQTLIAQLNSGEAEATALASELASPEPLLLEDSKGRRIALEQGLPAIGNAGVPIMAKDLDLPPEVRPLVDNLREAGLYLGKDALAEVLRSVGEESESTDGG